MLDDNDNNIPVRLLPNFPGYLPQRPRAIVGLN
jgi:hypothetical protein